ncbi:CBO0543 family protein [Anaerobacillus sp. CMMVII]|uniref:CBO0543 family protein n=1 Tax=Anaerobacillus sp. CMMVII TaxID=2755588 RepID=UPI0037C16B35
MQQFEKKLLYILLLFGLISIPFSLRGKNYKNWVIIFLLNSYSNTFVAPILAEKKFLLYPVRLLPKIYKSSIIYDYCLCSLVSVWYCRSTKSDHWLNSFLKVWLFSIPQAIVEKWLEKHTQLIKYNKGWTWIHSLLTITTAKLAVRSLLPLMNWMDENSKHSEEPHTKTS